MRFGLGLSNCLVAVVLASGCGKPPAPSVVQIEPTPPVKVAAAHLPNAYRLHERVISGGQPDGEEAFAELEQLGVKTVISVDGAKPDVEAARRHGMRYVHLPHGYDGIPEERAKELAKAVRDLPGPIYIHCHHGQHRSPAAATVACVQAGLIAPDSALLVLKTAGTSENYRGLYQSAERARRLDDALLNELNVEFRETVDLPPMAEAMVALERTFDHLKQVSENNWRRTEAHPDIAPAHEALLLKEHFTELLRTDESHAQPEGFRQYLAESEIAAAELEAFLLEEKAGVQVDHAQLAARFDVVAKNCAACHKAFRDVPLSEKHGP